MTYHTNPDRTVIDEYLDICDYYTRPDISAEILQLSELFFFENLDPNTQTSKGDTLLHYAVTVTGSYAIMHKYKSHLTISELSRCIKSNDRFYRVIEILLENGSDPNVKDHNGNTPLNIAVRAPHPYCGAWEENINIIRLLCTYGADIHNTNNKGHTPIYCARNDRIARFIESFDYLLIKEPCTDDM